MIALRHLPTLLNVDVDVDVDEGRIFQLGGVGGGWGEHLVGFGSNSPPTSPILNSRTFGNYFLLPRKCFSCNY